MTSVAYTKLQTVRRDHSMKFLRGLHDELLEAIERLKLSEAEVIRCLQKVEDHLVYRLLGYGSLFQYAIYGLRMPEAQAYNFITVSRKARVLPVLQSAIESGEVTVSKVRKVAAVINEQNQNEWIELCRTASAREIEKAVASMNPRAAVGERAVAKCVAKRNAFMRSAPFAAIIGSDGSSNRAVQDAERIADNASAEGRVDSLSEKLSSELSDLPQPSTFTTSPKNDRKRKKPSAVFHEVRLRDQGQCQMRLPGGEICGESRWVEVHHIIAHAKGGGEQLENLMTLCHGHHQLQH